MHTETRIAKIRGYGGPVFETTDSFEDSGAVKIVKLEIDKQFRSNTSAAKPMIRTLAAGLGGFAAGLFVGMQVIAAVGAW